MAGVAHASFRSRPVEAAETDPVDEADQVDEAVDEAWDWIGPLLSSVGLSGMIGFACGAALKHLERKAVVAVGVSFILLQVSTSASKQRDLDVRRVWCTLASWTFTGTSSRRGWI